MSHALMEGTPENILAEIRGAFPERILDKLIVVGSAAIVLAMGKDARPARDYDAMGPAEVVHDLSRQPEWVPSMQSTGKSQLYSKGRVELGSNDGTWPNMQAMMSRGWKTESGLIVGGLPDVSSWKESQRRPHDTIDQDLIRKRLLDPTKPPLDPSVMPSEIELARSILPESALDHPDAERAIRLMGNALFTVFTLYGDPRIGTINRIVGQLEKREYGTLATYHNGHGLVNNSGYLQRYFDSVEGITAEDRLVGAIAELYSDINYGDGRESDKMPGGYDELRSARLAYAHAISVGFSERVARRIEAAVMGTKYDEKTKTQAGYASDDPVVRGVTGVDMQPLVEKESVVEGFNLIPENLSSSRWNTNIPLSRAMAQEGAIIRTTRGAYEFIQSHRGMVPRGSRTGLTLMEETIRLVDDVAMFRDPNVSWGYKPVRGWKFDNPAARAGHAAKLYTAADQLRRGRPVLDIYDDAVYQLEQA